MSRVFVCILVVLTVFSANSVHASITLEGATEYSGVLTYGGNAFWAGQAAVSHDGVDAAQSGTIAHNQTTWMQSTVTGPVTLSFWWKVSSESEYDYLRFYLDGSELIKISGEVGWTQVTGIIIPAGSHTIAWLYSKDGAAVSGSDAGWVDGISLIALPSLEAATDYAGALSSGGNVAWSGQTAVSHDGVDAARAGAISNSQSSYVETIVTGSGLLSFWWKVSSESGYDKLNFYINGVLQVGSISGEIDWTNKIWSLPAGTNTLRWEYAKDESDGSGSDTGWVDQIVWAADIVVPLSDALDNTQLVFTTGGSSAWGGQAATTHDGVDAARAGTIASSQKSYLETNVTGPGRLSYWLKVSSEYGKDGINIYLNGRALEGVSGEVDWTNKIIEVPVGPSTIKWEYIKDGAESSGADTAWIDQVVLLTHGSCGLAQNRILFSEPETNLCQTGNPSSVTGTGPWYWSCQGTSEFKSYCSAYPDGYSDVELAATGQARCYASNSPYFEIPCANTGQDADMQTGLTWPNPRFSDNGDGTVTDNLTRLVWLRNANCIETVGGITKSGSSGALPWDNAINWSNFLASGSCGLSDGSSAGQWRLPNIHELQSLIQYELTTQNKIINFESGGYWSSSTKKGIFPTDAWGIHTAYGLRTTTGKTYNLYVLPVRDSQSPSALPKTGQKVSYAAGDDGDMQKGISWPSIRFKDNSDGTVTDNVTKLVWLKNASCFDRATFQGALDYAKNLKDNQCGLSDKSNSGDWRIPNVNELNSLTDSSEYNPAITKNTDIYPSGHPFTNLDASDTWSSTSMMQNQASVAYPPEAYSVNRVSGTGTRSRKDGYNYVWPVRGGQGAGLGSLNISSTALEFPAVWPGQSSSKTVIISSTLLSSVTIGTAAVSDNVLSDFSLGDSCSGQSLYKNSTCSITVNFAPRICGSKSATLTVPTSQGALTIALSGAACGVGASSLSVTVTDAVTFQPIAGATVMIGANGPFITDGSGNYNATGLTAGAQEVVVTKSGYDTRRKNIIIMPSSAQLEKISLKTVTSGFRVTSITSKFSTGEPYYFLPGDYIAGQAVNVEYTVHVDWDGRTPNYARFSTPRGTYKEYFQGSAAVSKSFNITTEFDPCTTLSVAAVDWDENASPELTADFMVAKKFNPNADPPTLQFVDEGARFSYKNRYSYGTNDKQLSLMNLNVSMYNAEIPFLFGEAFKLNFMPTVAFEYDSLEHGKYRVAWTDQTKGNAFDKDYGKNRDFRKFKRNFDDYVAKYKGTGMPKIGFVAKELSFYPYIDVKAEFNPLACATPDAGWIFSGDVGMAMDGSTSRTWQHLYVIPTPIPIPVPWYAKVKYGASGDASFNALGMGLNGEALSGEINIKPVFAGTLGAGVDEVVGVEGTVTGELGLKWPLPSNDTKLDFTLEAKATAYVAMFKYDIVLGKGWWCLLGACPNPTTAMVQSAMSSGGATTATAPELIPRDYLKSAAPAAFVASPSYAVKQVVTETQTYSVASAPVVTSTFPISSASLSSAGSNLNLLWLTDKYPERSAINRSMVQHSTYDGGNWSTPVAIADNGTSDFSPVSLTFSDGSIVAAWEDVKTAMVDTATLEELTIQLEVAAAIYDPGAKTWSSAVRLSENATLDRTPRLAGKSKDNLMLTWIGNDQNDLYGSAAKRNKLYYALYNGTGWSQAQVASSVPNAIKRYSVVYDGTTANVVLALDTDGDTGTISDMELYRLTFSSSAWGPLTRLTTDTIIDDNPQLALDPTHDVVLTWIRENKLTSVVNFDFANRTVIRTEENYTSTLADFKLGTASDGKVAIIYADNSATSTSDLFGAFYDPIFNLWGNPKQLTFDAETEMRASIAFMGTDTIVSVFNRKLLINPDGSPTTGALTDLYMLKHTMGDDLALETGSLATDPDNAAAGSSVIISATAQNLGDYVTQNIPVNFYSGDPSAGGTLIATATIVGPFKPGDTQAVSVGWTMPATIIPLTIFAVIDPAATVDTINRGNNVISRPLASPDLLLQGVRRKKIGASKYEFTIPVANIGGVVSPGSILTLRLGSETGEVLTTIPVAALERFARADYLYTFDNSVLQLSGFRVVAIVDEAGLIQEGDEDNNTATVNTLSETAVLAVTLDGSGGGTVTSDPQGTSPLGIACTSGTCSTTFPYGTIVNLLKTEDIYSLFNGWSVDCSGVDICTVAMIGAKSVTSTFNLAPKVKLDINASTGYTTFFDAYTHSTSSMYALQDVLIGDWTLSGDKAVVLKGGYQADYKVRTGYTILKGKLIIKNGSLRTDGVKVRQ